MKILIAIDKFKGSLTSLEAAHAIRRGIEAAIVAAADEVGVKNTYEIVEIADGGDGSADVLLKVKEGVEIVPVVGINPLGQEIESSYLSYYESDSNSLQKCAFIEMAKISGLELVPQQDSQGRNLRNPLFTTTYGLGQLMRKAYENGAQKITLSIGGSATNDGGTGMLQALGFKFYDKTGSLITDYMCGGLLSHIGRIEPPAEGLFADSLNRASGKSHCACDIEVICDVTNPLLGKTGATYVYGPQKGADFHILQQLEAGMENLVEVSGKVIASSESGESVHFLPGAGAAGGVGFAVKAFLNGEIISGWRFFANLTRLEERIKEADIVISGEGKIDDQSLCGKVVDGVLTLANKYGKRCVLFCGINALPEDISIPNVPICQLADIESNREKSMQNAALLLETLAFKLNY